MIIGMLKIAICDDEEIYRNNTEKECRRFFESMDKQVYPVELAGISCFSSGEEIIASGEEYDILFLDIEMPKQDGISVKEYFEKNRKQTRIIFLTSHVERAIDAFGKNVVRFLVKPLKIIDFQRTMETVLSDICGPVLEIEDNGEIVLIEVRQIKYIEAQDKYTMVAMEEENRLLRKTMKFWEENLSKQEFCRVHKSYLVNLEFFERDKDEVVLDKGKRVKMSRKNKEEILEQYKRYLRRKMEKM